jgi:hypothetical protein
MKSVVVMAESIYLWMRNRSMNAETLGEALHHASRKLRTE